jgi:hypothetical protein
MKKTVVIIFFLSISLIARSDVIYFPIQYTLIAYSAELIYSYEHAVKEKSSNVLWGGAGCVGSFLMRDYPVAGLEFAYERRRYFKPGEYEHFFISGYLGTALMTNFNDICDIGIIPGFKINYKARLAPKAILEPYISVSLPISYSVKNAEMWFPFPVATIGIRLGFSNLRKERKKTI